MITGANSGIGKATAVGLAKMGVTIVMVCRNRKRGESALVQVKANSSNESIYLILADLSSQEEIRKLADEFKNRYQQLHILINNAGVAKANRTLTVDGIETTFAVNHLAPFLLTNLLLDVLKAGTPARIVNVSSLVHKWGKIDLDDLQGKRRYNMDKAYNQSKLANVLFTYELARRLEGTGVTINALEPGMVATNFSREYTGFKGLMAKKLYRPFMKTPQQGAETSVYLASRPEVEGITGKYFKRNAQVKSSKESYDLTIAQRLWVISAELTKLD